MCAVPLRPRSGLRDLRANRVSLEAVGDAVFKQFTSEANERKVIPDRELATEGTTAKPLILPGRRKNDGKSVACAISHANSYAKESVGMRGGAAA